jgi:ribosome-associated protein
MNNIKLRPGSEYIELCDLLKLAGLCETGGEAKNWIAEGHVNVDGKVDTRKRAKIKPGQIVEFQGQKITVEKM